MSKEIDPSFGPIFEELASRCDDEGYTYASNLDIDRWAADRQIAWPTFMDQLGAELAKRYHQKRVSYEFGDSLANDLWSEMISRFGESGSQSDWSNLFFEVYEAFDAGEYHRSNDGDVDPVELYTEPAIAEIVSKLT